VHEVLRDRLGATAVGRLCPRCGSAEHGRPWVRLPAGAGPAPSVSTAYAGGLALVAWSWDAPVGVDVERADADAGAYGDATAWTRAEAVLKASGAGLARDPGAPAGLPDLAAAPLALGTAYVGWVGFDAPPGPRIEVGVEPAAGL
jgi:4'-phosphopantetheinyl transferase